MSGGNHNHVLVVQDGTQFFKTEREDMVNPYTKPWFRDLLDCIDGKKHRRMKC